METGGLSTGFNPKINKIRAFPVDAPSLYLFVAKALLFIPDPIPDPAYRSHHPGKKAKYDSFRANL
jgi:hypothetical protein